MHAPPASVHVVDLAVLARVNPVAEELRLRSKLSPELSDTYQGKESMDFKVFLAGMDGQDYKAYFAE